MSEEQINIAIAEECGIISKDQWGSLYRTLHGIVRNCPDYCNCLNAIHEAEKILNQEQKERYFLDLMCQYGKWPKSLEAIQATAHQRAEAFLRTIGKWKETK